MHITRIHMYIRAQKLATRTPSPSPRLDAINRIHGNAVQARQRWTFLYYIVETNVDTCNGETKERKKYVRNDGNNGNKGANRLGVAARKGVVKDIAGIIESVHLLYTKQRNL